MMKIHILNIRLQFLFITLAMLCVACQKSHPSRAIVASTISETVATESIISQQTTHSHKKAGTVVSHAIDCDNDGRNNDDGIPDDCISSDADSLTAVDTTNSQRLFDTRMQLLDELTAGCTEKIKVEGDMTYSICIADGQPVKAAEFLTELGDGLNIWFELGKVKAVLRTHSGEMFFFDSGGKLELMFADYGTQVIDSFNPEERNEYEELAQTAYQYIFQVFDVHQLEH